MFGVTQQPHLDAIDKVLVTAVRCQVVLLQP